MKSYGSLTSEDIMYMWLALKLMSRPRVFRTLMQIYPNASYIANNLNDVHKEYPKLIREADIKRLNDDPVDPFFERIWKRMKATDMYAVMLYDDDFPDALRIIEDAPMLLFVRGLPIDNNIPLVCIVGARKCTKHGQAATDAIVRTIAPRGVITVSGMAFGTDSLVAEVALESSPSECKTIAVMPGGADVCYPATNKSLYGQIIYNGTVLSQYEPGTPPRDFRFAERNRLMAALSCCVILTEGSDKSGALITARYAKEFNKPVFCVPGDADNPMSAAPNSLIASGDGYALSSGNDILKYLGIDDANSEYTFEIAASKKPPEPPKTPTGLTSDELAVYSCLQTGAKTFDELSEILKIDFVRLNMVLTSLEFSRIIKQMHGGFYSISI